MSFSHESAFCGRPIPDAEAKARDPSRQTREGDRNTLASFPRVSGALLGGAKRSR
jgi:hypothetical protein